VKVDPTQVIVALLAVAGVVYTAWANRQQNKRATEQSERQARRATELERRKVDQDAYDRARHADQETIRSLQREIERERALRTEDHATATRELERLGHQLDALRQALTDEQRENTRLREHIDRLERTIVRLRQRLVNADLLDERAAPDDLPGEGRG
jgi:FtsZ-interacting cell division protein ZipA